MDTINLKNCRILYSCGLERGGHHYTEDDEVFYDISSFERFEEVPLLKNYIVLTGERVQYGGGNYKKSEVSFCELNEKYNRLLSECKDEEEAKKMLLGFYDVTSLKCHPKYKNRYLLKKKVE
jgi:hypothetical protein